MPERNSISGTKNKKTYFWDAHLAYNFTHPAKSPFLLAPLAKKAGGWGTCKARDNSPAQAEAARRLFKNTRNADYQTLLKMVKEVKIGLQKNKRWDMPGFKPHPYYIREMKRYGILPETFDIDRDKVDVYELDRRYWKSFWHYPKGNGPKLYDNPRMRKMLRSPTQKRIRWEKDLSKPAAKPK